ncbi:MAG: class I SAM-dependent methyltransferase [Acidimicrobiales bacterium]
MARVEGGKLAGGYDAGRDLTAESDRTWDRVIARFAPVAGPAVDVGCGTGRFSALLARCLGVGVVGVEPVAEMLEQTRRKPWPPRAGFVRGAAEAMPLRDASCGLAWLSNVIHHFDDLDASAREVRRVVCAGGPVLVCSWFPGHTPPASLWRWFPGGLAIAETFPTLEQTCTVFQRAGFERDDVQRVEQVVAIDADDYVRRVRTRADSTLAGLPDEEFASGLAQLERDAAAGRIREPVVGPLDLVVLK